MAPYSEGRFGRRGFQANPETASVIQRMMERMRPVAKGAGGADADRQRQEQEEDKRRWEFEQRLELIKSVGGKVDWSDPKAAAGMKQFLKEFGPTTAPTAAPPTGPVSPRRERLTQREQERIRASRIHAAREAKSMEEYKARQRAMGETIAGRKEPGIFRTPEGRELPEEAMALPPEERERVPPVDLGVRREAIRGQRREMVEAGRVGVEAVRAGREPKPTTLPIAKPAVDPVKALKADAAKNALEAKRKGEPIAEVDRDILGLQSKTPDEKRAVVNEAVRAHREGKATETQTKIAEQALGIAEKAEPIDPVKDLQADAARAARAAVQAGEDPPEWARDVLKLRDRTPDEKQEITNESLKAYREGEATELQTKVAEKALGVDTSKLGPKAQKLYDNWVWAIGAKDKETGEIDKAFVARLERELDLEAPGWRKPEQATRAWPREGATEAPPAVPRPTAAPTTPERHERATPEQVDAALREAKMDAEETERILNAKGLTGNY